MENQKTNGSMEHDKRDQTSWKFMLSSEKKSDDVPTIRSIYYRLMANIDENNEKRMIPLASGDPSCFPGFRVAKAAEDAIVTAVRSGRYNGYSLNVGMPAARSAIAEYLNKNLPYKLSPDDVYVTGGCTQAIEILLGVCARPRANILLPRPGFPFYDAKAKFDNLEVRYFDLIPERGWEVDLESLHKLVDDNTVAMVIINPGNPCGYVYTYQHLSQIAETAKSLGIMIIADEVYGHLAFGSTPFTPMGVFGQIVPVITLGSISKRWAVPGWRLGWIVLCDPNGVLKETKVIEEIERYLNVTTDPVTFVQEAMPHIMKNTDDDFFKNILNLLSCAATKCYKTINETKVLSCPIKPEGSMFCMAKLELSALEDISDCLDFCLKLAKEESVIAVPGMVVGLKNWLRISFAMDLDSLEEALERVKSFCERHAKLKDEPKKDA